MGTKLAAVLGPVATSEKVAFENARQ